MTIVVNVANVDTPVGSAGDGRTTSGVPEHPRVSDPLARAVLYALLDDTTIGIALVRADDWHHVLTSATYERLLGAERVLGRALSEVLSEATAPRSMLEGVVATGTTARAVEALHARSSAGGEATTPVHLSFTFTRVRGVTDGADGVLVLAQDVTDQVHEHRVRDLFVELANDMAADRDEAATIRSSVFHAATALGAHAASIFLSSGDGKRLHGALVGWDWTRASFYAELESWPNVRQAVRANRAFYLTAETARQTERGWFEQRGIAAAICAPMAVGGRVLGVLFFDYLSSNDVADVDLDLAKQIADQCALLVDRAAKRVSAARAW